MQNIKIYIVECKTQKDEIITPSLLTYHIYGTEKEAQERLDMIYNNVRQHKVAQRLPRRVEARLNGHNMYPVQYWVIQEKFVTL